MEVTSAAAAAQRTPARVACQSDQSASPGPKASRTSFPSPARRASVGLQNRAISPPAMQCARLSDRPDGRCWSSVASAQPTDDRAGRSGADAQPTRQTRTPARAYAGLRRKESWKLMSYRVRRGVAFAAGLIGGFSRQGIIPTSTLSTPPVSARKELIVFMLVAAAALGSILSFALTSHRREAQTTPGTLVQAAAVGGVCPNEIKVQRGRDTPPTICAAVCAPSPGAPAQCDCTINRDSCRAVGTSASR